MADRDKPEIIGWCLTPDAARRAQAQRSDWIEDGVNYGSPDPGGVVWVTREAALSFGCAEDDIQPLAIDLSDGE